MTQLIKLNSDRPDYDQVLRNTDGDAVDLTDATSVHMLMWAPDGTLLVNDTAEVVTPVAGEVHYDFARDQVVNAGLNKIEFRVDWSDGDRQWFPVDTPYYELEVVESAGDRDADLEDPEVATDAEVNVLTVYDSIFVDADDGTLQIDNGDVHITGGDLTVSGGTTIGNLAFGDDDPLVFGGTGDFETFYDSTENAYVIHNGISDADVVRVSKGGDLTLPQGSLIVNEDVSGGTFTVWDASEEHVPLSVLEAITVTVAGNAVDLGGSTGIAHGDLADAPADAHHARYADEEAQDAVGSILSNEFTYDGTVPEITLDTGAIDHDILANVQSHQHHTRYADEEAQDAVGSILSNEFTYDDAANLISLEPGNVTHDDLAGIGGNNHHVPLEVQDDGTTVTTDDYVLDFGTNLTPTDNGDGSVTIDASGTSSYGDEDAQDAVGTILSADFNYDDAGDAIDMSPHAGDASAHHAKTTSASDLTDVSADSVADAHHTKYTDSEAVSAVQAEETLPDVFEQPNLHIQESTIPDGDHAAQPVFIPDGSTLEVWVWGARTDVPDTPAGLTVELFDETAGSSVQSESTSRTAGSSGSPVASLSASGSDVDATLRLDNGTGAEVSAGAYFGYTVS